MSSLSWKKKPTTLTVSFCLFVLMTFKYWKKIPIWVFTERWQTGRMRESMCFWQAMVRRKFMNQVGRRKVESYRKKKSLIAVAASLKPQITNANKWSANSLKDFKYAKTWMLIFPFLSFQICCLINDKAFYKLRKLTICCDRRPCSGSLWPTSDWQGWWDNNQNRKLFHHCWM